MSSCKESSLLDANVCRLCLVHSEKMYSIFSEEGNAKKLPSVILACVSLEVSAGDGLPEFVCSNCADELYKWQNFKDQCVKSYCTLRQRLETQFKMKFRESSSEEQEVEGESNDCKEEVGDDDDDDDDESSGSENDNKKKRQKGKKTSPRDTTEYKCDKCGKTFTYTSKFSFHACEDKRYVCNVCGNDYSTVGAVKTHLHIHKGRHKCETCGKSFPSAFQVNAHNRIHSGDKPFVCEFCGRRFAYGKGLALHTSVHTGHRPYKCDLCDYSTSSQSYIKIHKAIHSTEKPYVCEFCGQGYTLLPSLLNHQLTHSDHKSYICKVCNKGFNTRRKLSSHMVIHSGLRPFHCSDCGKKFARKDGLKEHKVVHTDYDFRNKVNKLRSGMSSEDVYRPSFMWYNRLMFLADHIMSRSSKSNLDMSQLSEDGSTEFTVMDTEGGSTITVDNTALDDGGTDRPSSGV